MAIERESEAVSLNDPASFDLVYREHAPRIRAFLRQLVGSPQAAEDVTQEVFTQLWLRPTGFDSSRGTLRAYLLGTARRRAADWWRRSRPEDPLPQESQSSGSLERDSVIADAIKRLPEEQRVLLWLREVEGQSYAELASTLDIPVGTVRSRLFTARLALRTIWLNTGKGRKPA